MSKVRLVPTVLLVLAAASASIVPLAGCKSDPEETSESVEPDEPQRGMPPVLQFAAVADIDEKGKIKEHPYADDTVRLRPLRTFDIKDARVCRDQNGYPAVLFVIADDQKVEFRKWTASLMGDRMAMLIDGKVIAVPKVNASLPGAGIVVDETRHWTVDEASWLAERIRDQPKVPRD